MFGKLMGWVAVLGFAGLAVVGGFWAVSLTRPAPVPASDSHFKVTLCHATGSETHPFTAVDVNIQSIADAQDAGGHADHAGDIIPTYTFTDAEGTDTFPGQNLGFLDQFGTTGQGILDAGCKIPGEQPQPSPTPETSPSPESSPTPSSSPSPPASPSPRALPTPTKCSGKGCGSA